jgi:xanthine dehydrogenase accessory factor
VPVKEIDEVIPLTDANEAERDEVRLRRTVAFAAAVYEGETQVEEITARHVSDLAGIEAAWQANVVPVLTGCNAGCAAVVKPKVVVDAILAKRNTGRASPTRPLSWGWDRA